jgi:anaerobic selenocysteine-containing dehydrogenase
VFLAQEDADKLGLSNGDPVMVRSDIGEMEGTVLLSPIKPRNVQVFWPEGNALIRAGASDPLCHVPDYNTFVEIVPMNGSPRRHGDTEEPPVKETTSTTAR